jgi:predicted nucleotidyltransferase
MTHVLNWERLPYPGLVPGVVRDVLGRIAEFPEVAFIAIFGSRAVGDADERSDVDVCVSAPNISLKRWLSLKQLAAEARSLLWITIIRFEDSPEELRRRNLTEGVIIYEREKIAGQSYEPASSDGKT